MLTIAVDGMGGDHAPASEVEGAISAVRDLGVRVLLAGPEAMLVEELARQGWEGGDRIEVVNATERISMSDPAVKAVHRKPDASINVAMRAVCAGRASGLASAGNTGAVMYAAIRSFKKLKGVDRPALATVVPTRDGRGAVVLDVGANAECRPEHLEQFAVMGSIYARAIFGIAEPRVGLLSIGEEEVKGNDLTKETHKLLKSAPVRFVGNVEGRGIFSGEVDVVVCDGFTGNVVLKTSEGIVETALAILKGELREAFAHPEAAPLLARAFKAFGQKLDYAEYGGAPLLGVAYPTVICHGRSSGLAIRNAIRVAARFCETKLDHQVEEDLATLVSVGEARAGSGETRD